jgi:hypothetical protein
MTTGAGVSCVVCGTRPYPEFGPPDTSEDFDLVKLDHKGHPANSPASGEWLRSRHFERIGGCCRVTAERIPANEDPAPSEATS